MSDPKDPQVTCPSCSATYRWHADQAGRIVPCKQCGTRFAVPDQPGRGLVAEAHPQADTDAHLQTRTDTETDAGIYELADDPDEEPPAPPPAYTPPTEREKPATPQPRNTPPTAPAPPAVSTGGDSAAASAGEAKHLSEAAKAARREQQRLAAAEAEAARSWRDFKWLYIALGLLVFLSALIWSMYALRDWLYG